MVHHDVPHQLRGRRDKVDAVLPDRLRLIDQPQVGFVEERGRLQCVTGVFPRPTLLVCQPVQFGLDQGEQLLKRSVVSAAPVAQQLRDILLCREGHRPMGRSTP